MTENASIVVLCPGCSRKSKAIPMQNRGRKGRCPACKTLFIIDDPPRMVAPGPGVVPTPQNMDWEATRLSPSFNPIKPDTDATRLAVSVPPMATDAEATRLAGSGKPIKDDPDAACIARALLPETGYMAATTDGHGRVEIASTESHVPLVWRTGDRIMDTYRVDGILGRGAFGTVYLVRHLGWDMDLAVKTPNPEALDAHGAEIFTGEAETWSGLGLHPHIVSCYYVRNLGGVPRAFAEYLDGGSLQECIEQSQVDALEKKLDIAIQFAWGLAYAHSRGLVHKDVKPANVMLTADGRVKVTDFGLTRAKVGHGAGEATALGGSRTILVDGAGCTPAYASPEQLAGQPVSRVADIWSWAVSVLAMFTGGACWRVGVAAPAAMEDLMARPKAKSSLFPAKLAALLKECFILEPDSRLRDLGEAAARLITLYREITGKDYPRPTPRTDQALSVDNLVNRALSQLDLGHRDQAVALLSEALSLQPHHPEASYNIGLLRWRAGEITDMDLVLELEEVRSTHTRTWIDEFGLALVHMERGDFAAAVMVLESIHEEDGKDSPQVREALQKSREQMPAASDPIAHWGNWGQKYPNFSSVFSDNGKRVIIAFQEQKVAEIYDVMSGKRLQTLEGHENNVLSVDLSCDGGLAVTGSSDQTLKLWDVAAGTCLKTFKGHMEKTDNKNHGVNDVRISKDGSKIFSCGEDKTIREWDIASEKCLRIFTSRESVIKSMDLTSDEKTLIAGELFGNIGIWDLPSGKPRSFLQSTGKNAINIVRITSDGRFVLTGENDGLLRIFDADDEKLLFERRASLYALGNIALDTNSRFAATGGFNSNLKLWSIDTGRCLRTFELIKFNRNQDRSVFGIFFRKMEKSSAILFDELYRVGSDIYHAGHVFHSIPAPWLLCRVIGSEVVSESAQHYEQEMKEAGHAFESRDFISALRHLVKARGQIGYEREPKAVALSGRLSLHLPRRTLRGGWQSFNIKAHDKTIRAIAVSPDGSRIVSGAQSNPSTGDAVIKIWDAQTGKCLREIDERSAYVYGLAITSDGRRLISSFMNKPITVWHLETGQVARYLEDDSKSMQKIILCPDDRFVYGVYINNTEKQYYIGMWDLHTGIRLRTIASDDKLIWGMNINRDGSKLASYFANDKIILWDPASGERDVEFAIKGPRPRNLFFSPGNETLCFSGDGNMVLFDMNLGKILRQGKGIGDADSHALICEDWNHALVTNHKNIECIDLRTMGLLRTFEGHQSNVCALSASRQGHFFVSGDQDGNMRIWRLDWELEPKETSIWDDSATPYLRDFLSCHRPRSGALPQDRSPTGEELKAHFHRIGRPVWNETDFQRLLCTLQCAGLGWIRPQGIKQQLEKMAEVFQAYPSDSVGNSPRPNRNINTAALPCECCGNTEEPLYSGNTPYCSVCGSRLPIDKPVSEENKRCPSCGSSEKSTTGALIYCANCGRQL
jgi:WD40 repeat protein/serine/threonine protein kinase